MTDLELYKRITDAGLTPNQYFAVLFHIIGVKKKTLINDAVELRRLFKSDFLTENFTPTQKLLDTGLFSNLDTFLVEEDHERKVLDKNIQHYILLFPQKRLNTGAYARSSVQAVKLKFIEFFQKYDYDWETIYRATETYVNFYANDDFKWMRSCLSFIINKDGDSQLALECEAIVNKVETKFFDPFSLDI